MSNASEDLEAQARREAAAAMGRARTEKKALAARDNGVKGAKFGHLGGRPAKPLSDLNCKCGPDIEKSLNASDHLPDCPRGRAIKRRALKEKS